MADDSFYIENPLPDSSEPEPSVWSGFENWIEIEDEDVEDSAVDEPVVPRGKHSAARVREALDARVADVSSRREELESEKERIARETGGAEVAETQAQGNNSNRIDLDSYESIEELESYWRKRRRSRSKESGSDAHSDRSGSGRMETADRARKGGEAQAALARAKAKAAAERKDSSLASKVVLGIFAAVAAVIAIFALYIGGLRSDVSTLSTSIDSIKEHALSADAEGIRGDVDAIENATADLKSKMSGPIWRAFSKLPNVAIDMANVEVLVDVIDDITKSGLRPLADNSSILSMSSLLEGGNINVETLAATTDILGSLGDSIRRGHERISALQPGSVGQINSALIRAKDALASADAMLGDNIELIPDLLEILGAGGQTKHYVIAALNTSETRPAGGMVGSVGMLTVTDGHFEIGSFVSPNTYDPIEVEITDSQRMLMAINKNMISPHRYTVNATLWPDFPTSARTIADHWIAAHPDDAVVDGVIAIDPVFLQKLLTLAELDITTSRGETVYHDNAAQALLSDVYWNIPEDEQDSYFAEVASLAFNAIRENVSKIDAGELLSALNISAQKRHLMMWFADESAQGLADRLGFSARIPTDPAKPQTGLYYYCIPASKMVWYLERSAAIEQYWANADGTVTYQIKASLTNTLDAETVANGPQYAIGKSNKEDLDRKRGDMTLQIFLYAPAGGFISDLNVTNDYSLAASTEYGFGQVVIDDMQIVTSHIKLAPGETLEFTYYVTVSPSASQELVIDMTPNARADI